MKAGIVCPSDSECILDRAFVDRLVREPAGFARQIRVVPAVRDGETVGFKLYGPANGLLKQLGLRRGDRVEAINGVSLRSLDALLQTMLGEAKPEYMVTLQRRGRTVHKRYRIVPSPYDDVPSR
jgi:general secretion pathway protein C